MKGFKWIRNDDETKGQSVEGIIEIGEKELNVEINWSSVPLTEVDIFSYLSRNENNKYFGSIIIHSTGFDPLSIDVCRRVLSKKLIVLCELAEIVTLLERNELLIDFFKVKINSAIFDRNPFFKPLNNHL